jgi:glycosyltransferase involved in cell wall biosynthesis
MNSLKILITYDAAQSNGEYIIPHIYRTQIEYLRRAGNQVQVYPFDDRTSLGGIVRNLRRLKSAIAEFHPHLLVSFYGTVVGAATRFSARRLPFVITFAGSDLLGTSNPGAYWRLRDFIGRRLSLWAAQSARQIIVQGKWLIEALPAALRAKTHNLPNGIDVDIFSPQERFEARCQLGWPEDEKVVLFNSGVGSGQIVKNLPLAQETLARLARRMDGVRLELLSTYPRQEVCLRMNAANCLLVTSFHEGSPGIVKEAMACNLPVLSVPCGDVAERLQGVEPSFICPYDAGELAKALEQVLRSGCRSNGREQLFKQGMDIETITQRVLAVYRQAVGD